MSLILQLMNDMGLGKFFLPILDETFSSLINTEYITLIFDAIFIIHTNNASIPKILKHDLSSIKDMTLRQQLSSLLDTTDARTEIIKAMTEKSEDEIRELVRTGGLSVIATPKLSKALNIEMMAYENNRSIKSALPCKNCGALKVISVLAQLNSGDEATKCLTQCVACGNKGVM
jgi:DNA-directed RNA polymerase subunit M/transcription elongation factor TFIIS